MTEQQKKVFDLCDFGFSFPAAIDTVLAAKKGCKDAIAKIERAAAYAAARATK